MEEEERERESARMVERERSCRQRWEGEEGEIEGWDKKRKKMRWRAAWRRKCRNGRCPSKPWFYCS